jgi:hypothetical protein
MKKTSYTQGTWAVDSAHDQVVVANSFGNVAIAETYGEDWEANARLIAAAPEMLEALQNLYLHCAMIHTKWGEGSNQKEASAAMNAGRRAIKKALGE